MKLKIKTYLGSVLKHIYINPLEKCNLKCEICYTRKTAPILSEKEILDFVDRYRKTQNLETITFCGGEVFTLKYFPGLVNKITQRVFFSDSATRALRDPLSSGYKSYYSRAQMQRSSKNTSSRLLAQLNRNIFVQVITNGTFDRLDEFENPNMVNLIVSLDGLKKYHDENRGQGSFAKSIGFIKKALKLGFHVEIFSIVTRQNLHQIPEFEQYLSSIANIPLQVTYHPRKPLSYLDYHPKDNIQGKIGNFDFLKENEMKKLMKERRTFPPKKLGCYQISLMSDGKVYGCCEGIIPIGKIDDDIDTLFTTLKNRLEIWQKNNKIRGCLGCPYPDFVCGIKELIK